MNFRFQQAAFDEFLLNDSDLLRSLVGHHFLCLWFKLPRNLKTPETYEPKVEMEKEFFQIQTEIKI